MSNATIDEKRKTKQNQESDILEARVIANYGDPGLDEDYHFDILSRYVVVMLESCHRVPTQDKAVNMFALVRRPEHLWIYSASTPDNNPVNQKRVDANQNMSVGVAGGFALNGISRIAPAYTFGETIRIRRLPVAIKPPNAFFTSAFHDWQTPEGVWLYKTWHQEGSSLPYFANTSMKEQLRYKTIIPISTNSYEYVGALYKMQYEAFYLNLIQSNASLTKGATNIFDNSWSGNPAVYNAHGGYIFQSKRKDDMPRIVLNGLLYEDLNVGGKARVATNDCIPLVVTTPHSFPLPSVRQMGTIIYNPTYSPISR